MKTNILLFIIFVLFTACQTKESKPSVKSTVALQEKSSSVEVIHPAKRSFTANSLITGTAMPNKQVQLLAMESGYLKSIQKEIGDKVKKGDIIAYLENPQIAQLVSDANANLSIGEASLMTAKSILIAAQADFKTKKTFYSRLQSVYEKTPELTPISQVEQAEGEALIANAIVETKKNEVSAQETKIKALIKSVEIANRRNAMLTIRAPFSGLITARMVDNGAMIQSGLSNANGEPLVIIQNNNPIRLTLDVPATDAASIKTGMDATIVFPELASQSFTSKISRTSSALDPKTKTMKVEIDIDNKNGQILSGMYAKVQMELSSRDNVLSLPYTTQIMYQDEPHVLVVNNSIVERIAIRKGLLGKDYFEVLNSEINTNTKVITKGKGFVKVGQKVTGVLNTK